MTHLFPVNTHYRKELARRLSQLIERFALRQATMHRLQEVWVLEQRIRVNAVLRERSGL
jgi:hypothetical protein